MALRSDAAGDRVGINSAPSGDFTVMYWWRATALNNLYDVPFWMGESTGTGDMYRRGFGMFLAGATGNEWECWALDDTGPRFYPLGGGTMSINTWYHTAMVANTGQGQTITWYQDGAATASSGTSGNLDTYAAERVEFCNDPNLDNFVAGRVCFAKIWNRQLTAAEVANERFSVLPVSPENIWGCWSLIDDSGGLLDLSGNGRDLTETNTMTVEASDCGAAYDFTYWTAGWNRAAAGAPAGLVKRLLLLGVGA